MIELDGGYGEGHDFWRHSMIRRNEDKISRWPE
jgi:hypothetical protein